MGITWVSHGYQWVPHGYKISLKMAHTKDDNITALRSEEGGCGHVTAIITDIPSSRIVDTNDKNKNSSMDKPVIQWVRKAFDKAEDVWYPKYPPRDSLSIN